MVNGNQSKKAISYYNIRNRLNIYIRLYYIKIAAEFIIPNNYIIFLGKNKYK